MADRNYTLEATELRKSYGGRTVVNSVSFHLNSGEVVGLLGPNGAGKTTSFYMVVGLVSAESGSVMINDRDITREPMFVRAQCGLGYLPQEPSCFRKLTVKQNVMAILETLDLSKKERKDRLEELLNEFDLIRLADTSASALSGGERRRVEITRALVRSPHFILLDEPFAGIDPIIVGDLQKIIASIRDRGVGILITDHNVRETLGICDRAYILVDGKILVNGSPEEIALDENARRYYLGDNFAL